MLVGVPSAGQRHLVRAPGPLGLLAVDLLRAGPALRGAQHDHRPGGALGLAAGLGILRGLRLDLRDPVQGLIEHLREATVDLERVLVVEAAGEDERLVPVTAHQRLELVVADPGKHSRVRDLVPVQVQDRQHHPVLLGIEELVGVPGGGQRPGLRLAVADHGECDLVGAVEHGAVGVGEGVAELPALVDRAGRLRGDVRGDPAGEGELREQALHPLLVLADRVVHLGVGALEIGRGDQAGAAVPGTGDVHGVQPALDDGPVRVGVEEGQARGGAPVPEQPRLDVLALQGLAQQRIVLEVDLADREVVRGAPPGVEPLEVGVGGSGGGGAGPCGCGGHGAFLTCLTCLRDLRAVPGSARRRYGHRRSRAAGWEGPSGPGHRCAAQVGAPWPRASDERSVKA